MANLFKKFNNIKNRLIELSTHGVDLNEDQPKVTPKKEKNSVKHSSVQRESTGKETKEATSVMEWKDRRKDDTLYVARPSILISFPMSKPKDRPDSMHLVYQRGNGSFNLRITADAEFGMPYGQDQLFVLAVVDHALKNGSAKVEIGSIYKILKNLGMPVDGRKYKLVQQTILRVFGSVATYWYQEGNGITGERCLYFKKVHLEILKDKYEYKPEHGDYIILSDELYKELKEHPIPYDLEMLRKLKRSEGATRLYLWAAQRAFRISHGSIFVPFEDLANDIGSDISKNPRKFKQNLKLWIEKIEKELIQTTGQKFLIKILDKGIVLYKANLVPDVIDQSKSKPKKISNKQLTEFDIDWVLEKEIEDFNTGLTPSISQQAIKYKSEKAKILKM